MTKTLTAALTAATLTAAPASGQQAAGDTFTAQALRHAATAAPERYDPGAEWNDENLIAKAALIAGLGAITIASGLEARNRHDREHGMTGDRPTRPTAITGALVAGSALALMARKRAGSTAARATLMRQAEARAATTTPELRDEADRRPGALRRAAPAMIAIGGATTALLVADNGLLRKGEHQSAILSFAAATAGAALVAHAFD